MHKIPFFGDVCLMCVGLKRKGERSGLTLCWRGGRCGCWGRPPRCVAPDDFQRLLNTEVNLKRDLKQDEIGVCVFPSIHATRKRRSILDAFGCKVRQPVDVKETWMVERCTRGLN